MTDTKPQSGIPLPDAMAGNFQEAVRWFNQMWGGAGATGAGRGSGPIPSVLMPTLDLKELDKRIADLRSVEHWLQLNQGLLHTTIQGLEMQRNTLSTWQSFGAVAGAAMEGAGGGNPSNAPPKPSADAAGELPPFQPTLWWAALQQQFAQMAASAAAGGASADVSAGAPVGAPSAAADAGSSTPAGGPANGGDPKIPETRAPAAKSRSKNPDGH
jgi:hypothetical protein